MTLKKKYIFGTLLPLIVLIGFFSWQSLALIEKHILDNRRKAVSLLSGITKNGLYALMLDGRGAEFQKFIETLISEDIEAVRIVAEDGTVLRSSFPLEIGKKIREEEMPFLKLHKGAPFAYEPDGRGIYAHLEPIRNNKPCQRCHDPGEEFLGILNIEISKKFSEKRIADAEEQVITSFIIIVAVLSLVVGVLGLVLIKHPFSRLRASIQKAQKEDLRSKIPLSGPNEINVITEDINGILSQLEKARTELGLFHSDERKQIEKMASIGELAAAVAHEIKNPLAGISGALQVLAEDFPEDSPRKEIANDILREIERLDSAVKDLIVFAKPPELHLILTDINAIISKVRESLEAPARKSNVRIEFIPSDVHTVTVDPDQIEKALLSISAHSLHSMTEGGTLTIAVKKRTAAHELEITFSDTGTGLSEDDLTEVFKPRFSLKHLGTGLGLAISRNIIESHKGRIKIESKAGSGTTFRVILPQKG